MVNFPTHKEVLKKPLRLKQVVLFAYIAEIYGNSTSTYKRVAEELAVRLSPLLAELQTAETEKKNEFIREIVKQLANYLGTTQLTKRAGKATKLSDVGRLVGEWARGIKNCVDGNAAKYAVAPQPRRLTIATHHYYEWIAFPSVIQTLTTRFADRPWKIRLRQVDNIYQAIDLLREGEVDAVVDGVPAKTEFPGIHKESLGLNFRRVVLVPRCHLDDLPSRTDCHISLADLKNKPLAYVDMPSDMEEYLESTHPKATRLRLSTTASVVKMVQNHNFCGFALNWKALWQQDTLPVQKGKASRPQKVQPTELFEVFLLSDNDTFDKDCWTVFCRPKDFRDHSPKTLQKTSVELLYEHLRQYARTQASNLELS